MDVKNRKNIGWYLLFTVPLLVIFTIVVVIPFVIGIYYAFFDWDGIGANPMVFTGLENFRVLLEDERFLRSAWLTVLFTVMSVVSVNVVGLAFALLVTSKLKLANLAR